MDAKEKLELNTELGKINSEYFTFRTMNLNKATLRYKPQNEGMSERVEVLFPDKQNFYNVIAIIETESEIDLNYKHCNREYKSISEIIKTGGTVDICQIHKYVVNNLLINPDLLDC